MALIDELKGLHAELAGLLNHEDKKDRAGQVRRQIAGKRQAVEAQLASLEAQGQGHITSGQDGLAGETAAQARQLRDELAALPVPGGEGRSTTEPHQQERAINRQRKA